MLSARIPPRRRPVLGESSLRVESLLRHGSLEWICAEAIAPVYQPIVEMPTGRTVGCEVLARWVGGTNQTVSPIEFIPFLAANGLLSTLTKRLLGQACREAASWPEHLTLAVNIAPAQLLETDLPAWIRDATEPTGFPLNRLQLEITEEPLHGSLAQAQAVAGALRAMGIALVMDDYGAGASDLRRLQQLPFERLKLDSSLTQPIEENPDTWRPMMHALGIAAGAGLRAVAEGVETALQAAVLEQLGCPFGQGWLFGAPVPAHELGRFLAEKERPPGMRSQSRAASVADLLLGPTVQLPGGSRWPGPEVSPVVPVQDVGRGVGRKPDVA
jgi:EAL domain-containing protein (putative c-di-GMP-specific phosphodiesterase class I)